MFQMVSAITYQICIVLGLVIMTNIQVIMLLIYLNVLSLLLGTHSPFIIGSLGSFPLLNFEIMSKLDNFNTTLFSPHMICSLRLKHWKMSPLSLGE